MTPILLGVAHPTNPKAIRLMAISSMEKLDFIGDKKAIMNIFGQYFCLISLSPGVLTGSAPTPALASASCSLGFFE